MHPLLALLAMLTVTATTAATARAADAAAAPQALLAHPQAAVLAGEQLLYSRIKGRVLTVYAKPLAGGAPTRAFAYTAPKGSVPNGALAASAQRAAITVTLADKASDIASAQAFSGPLGGAWTPFAPMTRLREHSVVPWRHQVDGDRVFTAELRGSLVDQAVVVRDPEPHDVAFLASAETLTAVFAGDLVAYAARRPGAGDDDLGSILTVRDWRTGAVVTAVTLPGSPDHIALRPDGRVAATTDGDELYEVRPGAAPRLLTRHDGPVAYAGERIVFGVEDQLRVIEPDGRVRAFGVRSSSLDGFATAGTRVLWRANGCLLLADVTAPAAEAPAPGPCARSEVVVAEGPNPHLGHDVPVVLRCVAAPSRCRGTVRILLGLGPRTLLNVGLRYSIPSGQARRLHVPLTGRGYRALRKAVAHERGALVGVEPRGDDGDRLSEATKSILILPRGAG